MTRVVAIDTSTWWGGVALVDSAAPEGVVAEAGLRVEDTHTAHQLRLLEQLLAGAGWSRSTVDGYAAARGPGSFTGIRVGLATVRGLGLATGRPCLGITTLLAMAEAFGPAEAPRVPLLDAGRGEVYGARYDAASSPPVEQRPPWLGPPSLAADGAGGPVVLFGPGARAASGSGPGRVGRTPSAVAAALGRLAVLRIEAGAPDGEGLSPLYLRPADAELKRKRGSKRV